MGKATANSNSKMMKIVAIASLLISCAAAQVSMMDSMSSAMAMASPTSVLSMASKFWDWDRETVKKGIFENENIMIHVGQNLFNFIMTTLAWFTVSQVYSLTAAKSSTGRQMPSYSLSDAADEVLTAIRNFEHKY